MSGNLLRLYKVYWQGCENRKQFGEQSTMRHDWIKRSTKAIEIEALHYQTVEQLRSLLGTYQESGERQPS